jgi:hypothetical protein
MIGTVAKRRAFSRASATSPAPGVQKMPNGRSGGFMIKTADFKKLVKTVPDTVVIGLMLLGRFPIRAADAAEVDRFVEECPHDCVAVEEQDHKGYVIHLSNEPKLIWLLVASDSPIFLEIRRRHAQWMTDHPGWKGWMGF